MNEDLVLLKQLDSLRALHKQLDDEIDHGILDDFTRQRKKKERVHLLTEITKIERMVYPDIIA